MEPTNNLLTNQNEPAKCSICGALKSLGCGCEAALPKTVPVNGEGAQAISIEELLKKNAAAEELPPAQDQKDVEECAAQMHDIFKKVTPAIMAMFANPEYAAIIKGLRARPELQGLTYIVKLLGEEICEQFRRANKLQEIFIASQCIGYARNITKEEIDNVELYISAIRERLFQKENANGNKTMS